MKILLVIDQFDQGNNGTTISARRFAQALAADGNEVRVAAAGKPASASAAGEPTGKAWDIRKKSGFFMEINIMRRGAA